MLRNDEGRSGRMTEIRNTNHLVKMVCIAALDLQEATHLKCRRTSLPVLPRSATLSAINSVHSDSPHFRAFGWRS